MWNKKEYITIKYKGKIILQIDNPLKKDIEDISLKYHIGSKKIDINSKSSYDSGDTSLLKILKAFIYPKIVYVTEYRYRSKSDIPHFD